MLSRIAESLFWIGRYVERADGTARIVDVLRLQLIEDPGADEHAASRTVLSIIMGMPVDGEVGLADVGRRLVFDRANPSSVSGSWWAARENARRARETIPTEVWESINSTWHRWQGQQRDAVGDRHLSWVRERVALVGGMVDSTMSHDDAWDFIGLGRSLERADMTARLVATGGLPGSSPTWPMVLSACGAQQAYLRSERGVVDDERAMAFLVLDRAFPRSVAFALRHAEERLRALAPEENRIGVSDEARRRLAEVRTGLEYGPTGEVLDNLPAQMQRVQRAVTSASRAVAARYFRAGPAPTWMEELA